VNKKGIHRSIAAGLRKLRKERRITQAELARLLGLSQAQLSKIENGRGSLVAEQLVRLLQEYSLSLSYFVSAEKSSRNEEDTPLQNALARLGAAHLRIVPGIAVPERLALPEEAVLETLIAPSSRLVTALAPVIVRHCESINFHRIAERLRGHGVEYRIWWVVDGTYHALGERLKEPYLPRDLHRLYQRAFLLLERKKLNLPQRGVEGEAPTALPVEGATRAPMIEDEFDRDLISERTIQLVKQNRDKLANHWRVVTRIKKADFEQALKDSEET